MGLFVKNRRFVHFGYTSDRWARGGARQLAQAQGGELLVGEPARAGAGARFELRLPLADPAAEDVLAYAASTR
jgi:hypothetical protein